jgi:hypothetical protein
MEHAEYLDIKTHSIPLIFFSKKISPCMYVCTLAGIDLRTHLNLSGDDTTYIQNHGSIVSVSRFLGMLMGIAIRTGSPLSLNLAEPMWKLLAGSQLTPNDITEV